MSLTITLDEKLAEMLQEQAAREGRDTDTVAKELLTSSLMAAAQDFAEAVEGIRRGFEDAEAGREKPMSEAIKDIRKRHSFPTDWPRGVAAGK